MQNLQKTLIEILRGDPTYFNEEKLLKNKLTEDALKLEPKLIKYVLSNDRLKKHFFLDINGVLVFGKDKFIQFVNDKQFLPDSYTSFKNTIGLLDENGDYFREKREVVLVWPYKDCVLEGGQDKEDEKRNEIFYNEILAPDEIDRLFDPKVLTNFKRYDRDGEHSNSEISRNDNLIIKGNNLLALHSLKKLYRGKVKLIYIDPIYNRDADTFYNDRFKHSTWLTFMQNRLEIASQLLCNRGFVFIHIDDNEQAYLKILCDQVFGRENFLNCIAIKLSEATGVKMSHVTSRLPKLKEYLLLYKKGDIQLTPIRIEKGKWDEEYKIFINGATFEEMETLKSILNDENDDALSKADKICSIFNFLPLAEATEKYNVSEDDIEEWKYDNAWRIARTVATTESAKKLADEKKERVDQPAFLIKTPKNKKYVMLSNYDEAKNQPRIKVLFADQYLKVSIGDFWQDIKTTGLEREGGVIFLKGKKPEEIGRRIMELTTETKDLVMDFFLGSGTTAAVAHKMGRRYIGIEQLDYGENDSVVRLKNVINGDQTGISKSVNWKGGGSFVYAELKKWNQTYIKEIEMAKTAKDLLAIYEKMKAEAFFRYDVDLSKFDEKEFEKLQLDQQKEILIECLDKNHLYVNLSEMDDATYEISDEDKEMNRKFYGF